MGCKKHVRKKYISISGGERCYSLGEGQKMQAGFLGNQKTKCNFLCGKHLIVGPDPPKMLGGVLNGGPCTPSQAL